LLNKYVSGALGAKCWEVRYSELFTNKAEEEINEEELEEEIISNIKKKVRGY